MAPCQHGKNSLDSGTCEVIVQMHQFMNVIQWMDIIGYSLCINKAESMFDKVGEAMPGQQIGSVMRVWTIKLLWHVLSRTSKRKSLAKYHRLWLLKSIQPQRERLMVTIFSLRLGLKSETSVMPLAQNYTHTRTSSSVQKQTSYKNVCWKILPLQFFHLIAVFGDENSTTKGKKSFG